MLRRHVVPALLVPFTSLRAAPADPPMKWADSSRLGRPFAKDPSVIRFRGRYLLYFSLPARVEGNVGWGIGIAESRNLIHWTKTAEIAPEGAHEQKGICAPGARVIDNRVHLFYQTYGNGRQDAICHAESSDGLKFARDATNPVFHPTGDWNAGRAIDADVIPFGRRRLLYAATRDPQMKVQMVVGAAADRGAGFGRPAWTLLADRPLLAPELPWERDCIEAPSLLERDGMLYMFYAGGYNNAPQQIGCARSKDGVTWERLSREPLLPNGAPGSWNSSESGHPGVFVDDDGSTYLFYQANNDNGRTWWLSWVRLGWRAGRPYVDASTAGTPR